MQAEIISVGTELLLGDTIDTNAAEAGRLLAECGVNCRYRQTLGDHKERLQAALELALSRSEIVITIGGLGPTEDDLTREAVAGALGEELELDPELETWLRDLFSRRKLSWVESNLRQAMRPRCATAIPNQHGTAPGLVCRSGDKVVILLPGPPREFRPMLHGEVKNVLLNLGDGSRLYSDVVKVVGLGESKTEDMLRDLLKSDDPTLAPYAKTGEVHLRITTRAQSAEEAQERLTPLREEIERRLGWHVYHGDSLEAAIVNLLNRQHQTVAVAESLTGGGIAQRLTSVPGASSVFLGAIAAYSVETKINVLGVGRELIQQEGVVSEAVAHSMAKRARRLFGSDFGVGITGVAGPGPDVDGNPEGLVYLCVAGPNEDRVERHLFGMGRDINRARSAQAALICFYRLLVELQAKNS